jgi:carboxypeptidase Q
MLTMFPAGRPLIFAQALPTAPPSPSSPSQQGSLRPPLSDETRAAVRELIEAARSSRAIDTVRSLTDGVGPRLSGSSGDAAAVAWALAAMKAQGFTNVRAEPVTVPHWERGEESGALLGSQPQRLLLTALGGSVGTPAGGLEAEVVEVESLEAVDALGDRAKGKIVFFWKVMERRPDGAGYGKTVPIRISGASRAAKVGAGGVLIRSVGTSDARFPHTGQVRYDEAAPKIPAAALAIPDADLLHRRLAAGEAVRVRFTLGCRWLPDATSANVVGEIRGREKPDEIVLLGGHLDSWDLGAGAVDDGAGCGIVLEAARLIGALPNRPRRTIRVVLFADEENGIAGGKAYAKAHASELERHVAAIEADSGADQALGFSWNAGPDSEGLLREVATLLHGVGADAVTRRGDGGADIGSLKATGVPLFGLRNDVSRYFDIHHSADDTFDKIDPAKLNTGVAAVAALAYTLADERAPLPRIPEASRATPRER